VRSTALAVLAFAVALLASLTSQAFVPQCEPEPVVSLQPEEDLHQPGEDDLCDASVVVDDASESPICLLEGASAVAPAPTPVLRTPAVEAQPTCTFVRSAELGAAHPEDHAQPIAPPPDALAPAVDLPRRVLADAVWLTPFAPPRREANAHAAPVYRPPRAALPSR
jgi:hypothetical protein